MSSIIAGILFGIVGLIIFRHGRRNINNRNVFLGLLLMIYPYFVSNAWLNWGVGFLICAVIYYYWDD